MHEDIKDDKDIVSDMRPRPKLCRTDMPGLSVKEVCISVDSLSAASTLIYRSFASNGYAAFVSTRDSVSILGDSFNISIVDVLPLGQ